MTQDSSSRMVRYVAREFGPPDCLELLRDQPVPVPSDGEVCIEIEACSVQYSDTIVRRGLYLGVRPPLTPGYEVIGRVCAVGPKVSEFSVGDRVADLTVTGGYATHIVRPAEGLVRVPESVDAAEAASVVLSGVTASQMLFRHAKVSRGQNVLIQGANGAVGYIAVQLAVRAGARVWGTARAANHAELRSLGVEPLDYNDPTYPEKLRQETGGGVDAAFDGHGADGFKASIRSVKPRGKLVLIGSSHAVNQGKSMYMAAGRAMLRNLNPFGPRLSIYAIPNVRAKHPDWFKEDLASLFSLLERGELRVRIERRIGFSDVPEAHRALEAGGMSGKIVLLPSAAA